MTPRPKALTHLYRRGVIALYSLICLFARAESIQIVDVPDALPRDTPLGNYSPAVSIGVSAMQPQQYVLKVWLLSVGSWFCASSQWCERTFQLDDTASEARIEICED